MDWLWQRIPRPIKWFNSLVGSGDPRVHAVIVLAIALTLCRSTVLLCRAAYMGRNVAAELAIVVGALTTLGTIIYNRGKKSEDKNEPQ